MNDAEYHANGVPFARTQDVEGQKIAETVRTRIVCPISGRLSFAGRYEHLRAGPALTRAGVVFVIGGAAFAGDMLFVSDYGTARADRPGDGTGELFRSIRRLLTLPDETRLFLRHDNETPDHDEFVWKTTVGARRTGNVHVRDGIDEEAFVAMRSAVGFGLFRSCRLLPPCVKEYWMAFKRLDDGIAVSPQLSLADLGRAAREGYRSITSNRPAGEEAGQPKAAAIKAERHGLAFAHIPIVACKLAESRGALTTVFAVLIFVVAACMLWKSSGAFL